jgi:hypothetical protein
LLGDRLGDSELGDHGIRLEVVRRPEQRRLVRVDAGDLRDDAATEDDDGAVADELDLLQLGRVEQHGGAGLREVPKEHVDLLLRADVDAAGRIEAEHGVHAARDPAGDRHLLLVPAREAAHLAAGARIDLQPRDGGVDRRALSAEVDRPPARQTGRGRQGDVLPDRALHQQRLGTVGRDVHQPGADRVGGMAEGHGRTIDQQLPAARTGGAGEDVEQFVLPLALERRDTQNLARV